MLKERTRHIVDTEWLSNHIDHDNLIILEVGDSNNKAGIVDKISGSIKGAISIDIKSDFSDPSGRFPNTFPTVRQFESTCKKLGITKDSTVVIVDRLGIYTSPRVWFIFRAMGHKNVVVLDGGLPAWIHDGYDTLPYLANRSNTGIFNASFNQDSICSIDQVTLNIETQESILIDARSAQRFLGTVPEPRPEIRSGQIANSTNIPFGYLLNGNKYKSEEELLNIFQSYKLDTKPLIFSCGSGVTACIVMLAADLVLDNKKSIYNGSWTEWASLRE